MRLTFPSVVFLTVLVALARAEVKTVVERPGPSRIRPQVVIVAADWARRIPPTGRVNAPEFLSELCPGEKLGVGLLAEGADRERIFAGVEITVRLSPAGGLAVSRPSLKPVTVRALKAEGADISLQVLQAVGISETDRRKIEEATSLVTLAVFRPEWTAPEVGQVTDLEIAVTVKGVAMPVVAQPAHLKIRPVVDWLRKPPLSQDELKRSTNRFRADLGPGPLLASFTVVAKNGSLKAPAVRAFFVYAFKASPLASQAAAAAYPALDPDVQPALLWVLRLGGHDLPSLFPDLPAEKLAPFRDAEPLADPRPLPQFHDPLDPQAAGLIGHPMDQCWAAWMATGDQSYLRALVDLLAGAADFPAMKAWQEAKGGVKGLNARVARGLRYQIAGWSIGSFQRTDPLVADWLLFWQNDATVPTTIRQEIAALATNPAFKRK